MMPPTDMPAGDLFVALQEMPRPSRVYDFPRKGADGKTIGQFRIWVLTQNEQLQAGIAAERLVRSAFDVAKREEAGAGYQNAYENAAAVELLFRACRKIDDVAQPLFPSPKDIRAALTVDEVAVLMNSYLETTATLGPILANLSAEDTEAWIDRLVEGGSASPLPFFSPGAVQRLLTSMVGRLRRSSTGTSSSGSPPSATEPDSLATDDGDSLDDDSNEEVQ